MDQSTTERVAGHVRAALARQRRTGRWLALAVGMSKTTMSRRLNGQQEFGVNELAAVAAALGVPIESLFADDQVRAS